MPEARKRPCTICRRWFRPDPRVGDRQRACHKPECQAARRQKTQAQWRLRNPGYAVAYRIQQRGAFPIGVNLRKDESRALAGGFSQLLDDFLPFSKNLGQAVRRQDSRTEFVVHEFNFPPSAASHCPIGIPRGKMFRPPPPYARPARPQTACHAATRVR